MKQESNLMQPKIHLKCLLGRAWRCFYFGKKTELSTEKQLFVFIQTNTYITIAFFFLIIDSKIQSAVLLHSAVL